MSDIDDGVRDIALLTAGILCNSICAVLIEKGVITLDDMRRIESLARDQQQGHVSEVNDILQWETAQNSSNSST